MKQTEIFLPAMGEGIIEATITRWLKQEGDTVNEDESLVEVATDKVDSEIPSPVTGKLEKILVEAGKPAAIGQLIAIISTSAENTAENSVPLETNNTASQPMPEIKEKHRPQPVLVSNKTASGKFLSPLVKTMIKNENLSMEMVESITGSGLGGRITKNDLIVAMAKNEKTIPVSNREPAKSQNNFNTIIAPPSATQVNYGIDSQIVEMDRVRKLIASHMVRSKQISPHVTSFVEANVTHIVRWREKTKERFEKQEGFKLTYTPVFFEATAKALVDFPQINVSVDNDHIVFKKSVHIGMATALENGNLIVPVIKDAALKNFRGLAQNINELANKARSGKLLPDDITGGTFTITNLGSSGTLAGTPIINQPETAILGIGSITKKPVVVESAEGDSIGIGYTVILSLSYDHRVIDGMLAGHFLNRVIHYLKNFDISY